MGDKVTLNLDTAQVEALGEMEERGEADSRSEAARNAITAGLHELGYLNGSGGEYLPWLFRQMATAFIYVGLGAIAVFYFFPVGFRVVAIVPILSGLVCLAAANALERHGSGGPAIRERLPGGDRA